MSDPDLGIGVSKVQLTHFFTNFQNFGGAQSTLKHHFEKDEAWGIQSNFFIFFEADDHPQPRVRNLGLNWRDSIRTARAKFRSKIAGSEPEVALYHNVWGQPFLADLDGAARRIGLLHTSVTMEQCLPAQRGLLDGMICLSKPLIDIALRSLPELAPDRITLLPSPLIVPEMAFGKKAPLRGRALVLGYAGRLIKEDKRVERLPHLFQCLENAGLNCRLEILGDGPERRRLQRQFGDKPSVVFHGYQTGLRYWKILNGWDVIVFVSDIEGLPLALLEGLSCGALPLFPKIGSGGDSYVTFVDEGFLYTPKDFQQAAQVVKKLTSLEERKILDLRGRCREAVEPHLGNAYFEQFSFFVRSICGLRRISRSHFGPRPFYWSDVCPFAFLGRLHPSSLYR